MRQLLYIATIFLAGCISDPSEHAVDVTVPLTGTAAVTVQRQQKKQKKSSAPADKSLLTTLLRDSVSAYDSPLEKMPEPTQSIKVIDDGDYRKIFNDSNYVQWQSAEKYGIRPLSDTRSHWQLTQPLVKVVSCADFYVQPLTYSRPYLVKEGADMLHEIGRRFRDTLQARGGGDYRIKVTSVLRTPESVARLRRNNRNAVDSSTHQFATTIDISYANFAADSDRLPRSTDDLKGLLAEVLLAMRSEGKLWVKYEHHQPCFHITVRGEAYQ